MTPDDSYLTVARAGRIEIDKVRGSRFVATVHPVADAAEAAERREAVARDAPDASHHCWAWRLDASTFRYGDDGEPSGTAGRPILQQIDGRRLRRTLVVVSRWFGGTKLGAGGLVRAYGSAAAAGLDAAGVRRVEPSVGLTLRFAYGDAGGVAAVLAAFDLTPSESAFGESVEQRVDVVRARRERLERELRERTGGRIRIES